MRRMPVLLLWAGPAVIVVGGVGYYLVRAVHEVELLREERPEPERRPGFSWPSLGGRCAMADKRALKLIGIMFAASTLIVVSTAAVVVAGHAASSNGEYVKLVDLHD